MLDLRERRELYNGFGNGLARAFELVATPAVFGFAGHLLDARLGTRPLLTLLLALLALAGMFARMYYGYGAAMKEHEATGPWSRPDGGDRA